MRKIYKLLFLLLLYFGGIRMINAQTYAIYPNDTAELVENLASSGGIKIHQQNLSSVPINLKYRKIMVSFPGSSWNGSLCDNGKCYTWLPDSGEFMPIGPFNSWNQWANLYVHAGSGYDSLGNGVGDPGTAIIRYAIWDIMKPAHIDTLTFLITAKAYRYNGLKSNEANFLVEATPNPANKELNLTFNKPCNDYNIEITTIGGEIIYQSQNQNNIDVSGFAQGLYFLKVTSAQGTCCRKFVKY